LYFFGDNYECKLGTILSHNIFCYGGFLIKKEKIKDFEKSYTQIKTDKYKIPEWLPLKWNLLDTNLKKFYEANNQLSLWNNIKDKSKELRFDVINVLKDFDIKVIFCSFRELGLRRIKHNLIQWAFTNILQRAFFESQSLEIVLDWDTEIRDTFFKSYLYPYYFSQGKSGETFFPICLQNIKNTVPFISFSSTLYNPFLQVADIVVGCCGSFIEYVLKNKNESLVKQLFPSLIPSIRGYKDGDIFTWGFIVSPENDKLLVIQRFQEMRI
jgi:hypothetical protein